MRLLLVGTPHERERLRAGIDHASLTVVGEFPTLAAARASGLEADGILIADLNDRRRTDSDRRREAMRPFTARQIEGDDEFEEALTPREIDVVELLAEGLSNKAIAVSLGISDQTVKFHVAAIYGKLGAANRTDAVRRAVRRGLISL